MHDRELSCPAAIGNVGPMWPVEELQARHEPSRGQRFAFGDTRPSFGSNVFIAPTAVVIADVRTVCLKRREEHPRAPAMFLPTDGQRKQQAAVVALTDPLGTARGSVK